MVSLGQTRAHLSFLRNAAMGLTAAVAAGRASGLAAAASGRDNGGTGGSAVPLPRKQSLLRVVAASGQRRAGRLPGANTPCGRLPARNRAAQLLPRAFPYVSADDDRRPARPLPCLADLSPTPVRPAHAEPDQGIGEARRARDGLCISEYDFCAFLHREKLWKWIPLTSSYKRTSAAPNRPRKIGRTHG